MLLAQCLHLKPQQKCTLALILLLFSLLSAGAVLRNDVAGKVLMKCKLSDMPELRLGLNEALEDVTFHQCVNLGTYEANKVVTFIPPDGEFELMR
jgi:hypothetical protein